MTERVESREAFRDFLQLKQRVEMDFLSEERRVTEAADIAEGEIEPARCRVAPPEDVVRERWFFLLVA